MYIAANVKPTASLIFLHGLGDTGEHWAEAFSDTLTKSPHVKLVCPTAHTIPVTISNGTKMPAWFDIKGLSNVTLEDIHGIKNATNLVHDLVVREINGGISSNRIVLAGFSQGGALALHSALTYPKKLAGVIAMSCWLPLSTVFSPTQVKINRNIPLLLCHGDRDTIVPYAVGQLTSFLLRTATRNLEFKTYPGLAHTVSSDELNDIRDFVATYLPAI